MEEYRSRVEVLEIENAHLQSFNMPVVSKAAAPVTPNWMKK
jgi:hypothetical protein